MYMIMMMMMMTLLCKISGCIKRRTKLFARWLHGTCIEAPPQRIESEDEPFVVSYFSDIATNSDIVSQVINIQRNIKNTLNSLTRYLMRWKRFRIIWKSDKVSESLCHVAQYLWAHPTAWMIRHY